MPASVPVTIIDRATVESLLDLDTCISAMREAFIATSTGKVTQPIRREMLTPDERGLISMMPGHISEPPALGIKVVSVFPGNTGTDFGSHQGVVTLFDVTTGAPVAMLDAGSITAVRTAAASAAATDALARTDAATLAILGSGEQAHTHLAAMRRIRSLRSVRVWSRSAGRAADLIATIDPADGLDASVHDDVQSAVDGADIVCTTTASAEPVLRGEWLQPGQHLNVVGSSVPYTAEVDEGVVQRSRLFCDYRASLEALGGEYRRAVERGSISDSHLVGEIGEVLVGAVQGRTSPDDITMFKSLGMAAEDLVAAQLVVRRATERGLGQRVWL